MENDFYNTFKKIIRNCSYENTYKMAWAKALVEISMEQKCDKGKIEVKLDNIATRYLKYYWNQTIFFDLIQGSNPLKPPIIIQNIKALIEKYYIIIGKRKPDKFERKEEFIKAKMPEEYQECIRKIQVTLKKDVSWRFIFLNGKTHNEIYEYEKGSNILTISAENMKVLKENSDDLFDIINYKWGEVLENFNSSPRINKKIRIIDEQNINRNSLNKFKKYLDLQNQERKCFICGDKIEENDLSIDHVIPWSYLYSDDIWNLVYAHINCNSSKNNAIPSETEIKKLKVRNTELLKILRSKGEKDKVVEELELAIEKDYVHKFWIGCK